MSAREKVAEAVVERVARAMFMTAYAVGDQRINDGLWERTSEMMRMDCRRDARAAIAAHLEALKADGYAVVSPATKNRDPSPSLTVRWADGQVVVHAEGCGVVRTLLDDNRHTPDAARELGAALLAAAQRAETT